MPPHPQSCLPLAQDLRYKTRGRDAARCNQKQVQAGETRVFSYVPQRKKEEKGKA